MIYRPQISACIVTYNNAGEVEKTIASLLEHTQGADLRLFVADNASSDGTPARIARQRCSAVPTMALAPATTACSAGWSPSTILSSTRIF